MASAQDARVGVLQCHLSGGAGMILAENQALDCVYKDDAGGPPTHYIGRLTNVGANIGTEIGCSEMVLFEPPTNTAPPAPAPTATDPCAPT